MFSEIAPTYDLLNRVLSLGVDQRWRAQAVRTVLQPFEGAAQVSVLDVASGTGDLTLALKRARPDASVIGADFAEPMLALARRKAAQRGLDVSFVEADGTALPYPDAHFDAVTIAYGLRNFADPDAGLREFRRVLKPGGRLAVLEFPPPPKGPFGALFRFYFRRLLPRLGGLISGKRSAYAYLPESVFAFFEPAELEARMRAAGFATASHRLQTFGVSALHVADVTEPRRHA
jgi:demethylmenaquinone methyltransferase/2-methoxy-6-polyprenyl-1,4-benzoquinol methylase